MYWRRLPTAIVVLPLLVSEPAKAGDSAIAGIEDVDGVPLAAPMAGALGLQDIFGVPNLDDDDENGDEDWRQPVFDRDNDVSTLTFATTFAGWSIDLELRGDLGNIRVWDGQEIALGEVRDDTLQRYTLTPGVQGQTLHIEFGDYNAHGVLMATGMGPDGETLRQEIEVRSSPLILNHHLQPTEHVWVMETAFRQGNNRQMVQTFADVLGDRFNAVDDSTYRGDVWVQDEIEFATSIGSQGQRLNQVIDSIRDRGLDPFPERELVRPDFINPTWGNASRATTWDSFGNLEASPPVSVDGVDYPFGRIYYGKQGNLGISTQIADFLVSQRIQAPVELDTFWLCVGHVDEFQTFVPDPSSAKGFKFLIADVPAAYRIIDALPADMQLSRYRDHGYATVGALRADAGLRRLNEDLQADQLDGILQIFRTQFGIEDEDIIRVPSLFEAVRGCGGRAAALIPGMVNLIVANTNDGTDLFIPDPFFRANLDDPSQDPFIEDFTQQMPEGLRLHYVDDWDIYHLGLGEVHCGTNVQRTPTETWWTAGLHLLEDE